MLEKMVPRDGVEPPTPAFSGLQTTAKSVISSNPKERKGTPGKPQERLLFLYCSHARSVGFLKFTSRMDWLRRFCWPKVNLGILRVP